jgi:histidine triad (HIT) family protein
MMTDCLLCQIVSGAIPTEHVLSNKHAIMIVDKKPMAPVHMLVVSRWHFSNIGNLSLHNEEDRDILADIFTLIDDYTSDNLWHPDNGYRVVTNVGPHAGQMVKHLHFHLLGGTKLTNDFGL